MRNLLPFLLICLSVGFTGHSHSQTATPAPASTPDVSAPAGKVRVVTRDVEPFSFEQDGRRVGFAAELWQQVAQQAGLEYEVQVVGTAQEMIDALVNKTADAAVGAISVTAKRETIIDFSQPFYNSGLQILVKANAGSLSDSLWSLVSGFLNWKVIGMFALLIFAMFIISHLVWMCEHKVNEEMWPKKYSAGMWESFWWTISTLLVGGADNKGPVGVGGRLVAIAWMLLSIVLVSLLTASFTTTMTVNRLEGGISGPSDLPGKKVATITGSVTVKKLQDMNVNVVPLATLAECIAALKKGDVEAVVYDAPMIQYALNKDSDSTIAIAGPVFDPQNYAIGLQQDSPLREKINQSLLALAESGAPVELNAKWFGGGE